MFWRNGKFCNGCTRVLLPICRQPRFLQPQCQLYDSIAVLLSIHSQHQGVYAAIDLQCLLLRGLPCFVHQNKPAAHQQIPAQQPAQTSLPLSH